MKRFQTKGNWARPLVLTAAMLLWVAPATAQYYYDDYDYDNTWDDYEYEPGEGVHEEEWYDPGDWFDGDYGGMDYEYDDWDNGYGYGYDDNYYYDGYYGNDGYYDGYYGNDYGYNNDWYGNDFGYDYDPYYYDDSADYGYGYNNYDYGYGNNDDWYEGDWWDYDTDYDYYYVPDNDRNQRSQQQAQRNQRQNRNRNSTYARAALIQGKIVKLDKIDLFGNKHVVAKLRRPDGKILNCDLGPVSQLRRLDLQRGDQITLHATPGLMYATDVRSDKQHVTLNRRKMQMADWAMKQQQNRGSRMRRGYGMGSEQSAMRNTRMNRNSQQSAMRNRNNQRFGLQGQIEDLSLVSIGGDKYLVADIKDRSGRTQRAALGRQDRVRNFDLDRGDNISIVGRPGRVNGQTVLIVEGLRNDSGSQGNRSSRNRSNQQMRGSRNQSQTLQGEVVKTWTTKRNNREHQLVKVELDNGDSLRLDLGPAKQLQKNVDIADGDEIAVRCMHTDRGRKVQAVKIDGQWTTARMTGKSNQQASR